eukprot:scaffold244878_cov37-Tisochrysis_lutea.AAC.2
MGRRGCAWGKISKDTYVYVCRSEASAHVKVYMQVRWGVSTSGGLRYSDMPTRTNTMDGPSIHYRCGSRHSAWLAAICGGAIHKAER